MFAINFPEQLSLGKLDQMLAQGWFRYGQCFQKPQVICVNDIVCDVLNIRLDIEKHQFSKSQRKLLRRNDKKFTIKIQKASINKQKEQLFQSNKFRFNGFLTKNLKEFLTFEYQDSIFNTYEIAVYAKTELMALSYFDMGEKSIASILGLSNWKYPKLSLGIYTMLKEIEFAKQYGFKYYYPGFIMVQANDFDYKLNLGKFSYLAHTNRWRKLDDKNKITHLANLINTKNNEIELVLKQKNINFQTYAYPMYSLDYMDLYFLKPNDAQFLNTCKFIELKKRRKKNIEIMYYNPIEHQFQYALAKKIHPSNMQINEMSADMHRIESVYTHILQIKACLQTSVTAEGLFIL